MEILKMNEIGEKRWEKYLNEIEGASFAYTAKNIFFEMDYAKTIIANESWMGFLNKKPILVAILYIFENEKGERSISWVNRECPAPIVDQRLSSKQQEKYMKLAMHEVDTIAKKYNCCSSMLKFEPIANAEHDCKILNYNYLIKYGYQDRSSLTHILDLRESLDILYGEVRKGHKSDIKKGEEYQVEFYDRENITEKKVKLYREIYESDAGMVTRNSEMWYHYYQFIKSGYGVIGFAKKEERYVAVIIVTYYKNLAYYSSYAEITNALNGKPVGHMLQWKTIQYLKNHGIDFYEVGEQIFGEYKKGTEEEKMVNISKFKRGFGGYTIPMFRGIKEY